MPDATTHVEKRPGGVTLAAGVLSLLICFGLAGLMGSVAALFLTRNPLIPRIASVRIVLAGFDLFLLLFLVWCAATVIGLFRLRPWARYSILVIGALDFFFFAALSAAVILARLNPIVAGMDAHPSAAMPLPIGAVLLALAVFYAGLALIGVWWLVYFNLRAVRLAFAAAKSLPPPSLTL